MILFALLLILSLPSLAAASSFGSWSFFPKKLSKVPIAPSSSPPSFDTSTLSSNKHEAIINIPANVSSEMVSNVLSKLIYSVGSHKKRLKVNSRRLIRSFPSFLFIGCVNYEFFISQTVLGQEVMIDLCSHSDKSTSLFPSKSMRIVIVMEILPSQEKNSPFPHQIKLSLKHASKGVKKRHVDVLLNEIFDIFHRSLEDQMNMISARTEKLVEVNRAISLERRKRKKLELDMIIHPDKYRKKSSGNVRRIGSNKEGAKGGGGGGRYRPSEAAQARRQVKSR